MKNGTVKTAIKAIETEYNGYKFRSRLEARWAVFFNKMAIKYEYEPEGFEVDGVRYLPDFYLPEMGVFVAVKPNKETIEDKWAMFVNGGNKLLLIIGTPTKDEMFILDDSFVEILYDNRDERGERSYFDEFSDIEAEVCFSASPLHKGISLAYPRVPGFIECLIAVVKKEANMARFGKNNKW